MILSHFVRYTHDTACIFICYKCVALASLFAVYASPTAQMRPRAIARNTSCYVCLLCPLRSICANATRLRLSLLVVSTERWFDTQSVLAVF